MKGSEIVKKMKKIGCYKIREGGKDHEQKAIPEPSAIHNLIAEKGSFTTYISCDTVMYRRLLNNVSVKKTLSIPSWLNDSAVAAGKKRKPTNVLGFVKSVA